MCSTSIQGGSYIQGPLTLALICCPPHRADVSLSRNRRVNIKYVKYFKMKRVKRGESRRIPSQSPGRLLKSPCLYISILFYEYGTLLSQRKQMWFGWTHTGEQRQRQRHKPSHTHTHTHTHAHFLSDTQARVFHCVNYVSFKFPWR